MKGLLSAPENMILNWSFSRALLSLVSKHIFTGFSLFFFFSLFLLQLCMSSPYTSLHVRPKTAGSLPRGGNFLPGHRVIHGLGLAPDSSTWLFSLSLPNSTRERVSSRPLWIPHLHTLDNFLTQSRLQEIFAQRILYLENIKPSKGTYDYQE